MDGWMGKERRRVGGRLKGPTVLPHTHASALYTTHTSVGEPGCVRPTLVYDQLRTSILLVSCRVLPYV